MELSEIVAALESLAPVGLAADWDNVGLLLEGDRPVRRILCTVDFTEAVLDEALAGGADLVVSYHPPIFRGLKRLIALDPIQRTLLRAARAGLHVYSPHTALDAVPGGMTDWLLEPFGPLAEARPIEPHAARPEAGSGRVAVLSEPAPLDRLLPRIKAHLGLAAMRLATLDPSRPVERVAVCPGAGGGVFERLGDVDLLLTGEMRHHDVLARVARGASVVLTDHTNTERGYLPRFAQRLAERTGLPVAVSTVDRDPLAVI